MKALTLLLFLSLTSAAAAADVSPFTPPAGWSTVSGDSLAADMQSVWQSPLPFTSDQFKMTGMWIGSEPMQMMTLSQGHAIASPDAVARLFPSQDVSNGSQVRYKVATQRYNFCGSPGTLVNVQFGGFMGFTMAYDIAVAQSAGQSYMLSYIHMAGAEDPAAERALRSLCPRGPVRMQPQAPH